MSVVCLESLTFGLRHLVLAADALGERLMLLTRDPSYYAYELERLPADALDVVTTDTFDTDGVTGLLRGTPGLRGLISSTDTWTLIGAELTDRLGLPGLDPAVLRLARDKAAVRNRLYEARLTRGRAVESEGSLPELREALLKEAGLPAVVKDTAGTGSQNVWLVRDEPELDAALAEAAGRSLMGRLFAEPYFGGPVYSAETLSWQGQTRLLGVSSRLMSPEPRFREEITAFPVGFPEEQRVSLERWLGDVLATVGYTDRFAHVEFVLTTTGPEVVEVNPRIGGALVGEGMCRSLGYNVYEAVIETALGRRPRLMDADLPGGPAVAFVLSYPEVPGVLTGVTGLERFADLPGAPAWYPVKRTGDPVEHLADSRGYVGIVYAEAETAELATHRAVAAANAVQVHTEPFADPSTPRPAGG
ncbi:MULTISPECIES: ATP-grasp domain-containing protein [Streptomyces]|uniref:Biotin carboxylase n=1 Tax=Streptomyces clavifer TaxID=68188 RepID=A0ABS4VI64_9ACTN|nr:MULTISPECIES: ATP-grasp domain-containing protein [Streptomyces]MBP2363476.1 biotin carboxylase [Streptomyces clavifer]MDX2748141.1 ATP-grasp domain-containing protein [Streptomyces sp. NRRL_B-2557]RPK71771.1 argininosuccinate lyase [Streptomyces sp. ADI97-07]GHB28225.1 argininosuccinate lyase [Streptomyces clavifer]